ncbi:MAG: CGNR zinc finger domain-containing protein, partial [Nocardioidaceae bacterium]
TSDLFGVNEARYHCANRPPLHERQSAQVSAPPRATETRRPLPDYPGPVMFSHDTEPALQAIVDLVNTDPEFSDSEGLADVAALEAFVGAHQISNSQALTGRDVTAVRLVRTGFSRFFGLDDPRAAAALANDLLAQARVCPRLTNHDGYDWHMHYFSPDASLAEHLAVDGGMALAHIIAADEIDRLRLCEAPDCHAALLDLSRNHSKRYCDASTCGNRLHVAAYRERKRSELLAQRS